MPRGGHLNAAHSPELYQKILAAYRVPNALISNIAKEAGVNIPTIRRVFEHGWPEFEWAPPIRTVLQQDGIKVRAALLAVDKEVQAQLLQDPEVLYRLRAEVRQGAHEQALKDLEATKDGNALAKEKAAIQSQATRAEEAEIGKLIRGRSRMLLSAGSAAMPEFIKMGDLLRRRMVLLNATKDADLADIDPKEVINLMGRYTDFVLKVGALVQAAQIIDRKAAGDPDFVHLHKQEEMTYEQALKVIEDAASMHSANVIEGDKGKWQH